jgi:hypothetical protein
MPTSLLIEDNKLYIRKRWFEHLTVMMEDSQKELPSLSDYWGLVWSKYLLRFFLHLVPTPSCLTWEDDGSPPRIRFESGISSRTFGLVSRDAGLCSKIWEVDTMKVIPSYTHICFFTGTLVTCVLIFFGRNTNRKQPVDSIRGSNPCVNESSVSG